MTNLLFEYKKLIHWPHSVLLLSQKCCNFSPPLSALNFAPGFHVQHSQSSLTIPLPATVHTDNKTINNYDCDEYSITILDFHKWYISWNLHCPCKPCFFNNGVTKATLKQKGNMLSPNNAASLTMSGIGFQKFYFHSSLIITQNFSHASVITLIQA